MTYRENNYPPLANSTNTAKATNTEHRKNTDVSQPMNKFLLQLNHQLTSSELEPHQKRSMKPKHNFNPTHLKNPDPSNAFFFVIIISVATILLPFIPIAVNYLSQMMEPSQQNNYHDRSIHITSTQPITDHLSTDRTSNFQ